MRKVLAGYKNGVDVKWKSVYNQMNENMNCSKKEKY